MSYNKILEEIFEHEGGYVDHPNDPGGATNMGITRRTLAAWRGIRPYTKLPKSEVRSLTKAEASEIYRVEYWNVIRGDDLPMGIACFTMDYGVNSGPARAVIHLQEILGVAADGKVGPITVAAAQKADEGSVIRALHARRMKFLKSLSTWGTFGTGWTRRNTSVLALALSLVGSKAPQSPVKDAPASTLPGKIFAALVALAGLVFAFFNTRK